MKILPANDVQMTPLLNGLAVAWLRQARATVMQRPWKKPYAFKDPANGEVTVFLVQLAAREADDVVLVVSATQFAITSAGNDEVNGPFLNWAGGKAPFQVQLVYLDPEFGVYQIPVADLEYGVNIEEQVKGDTGDMVWDRSYYLTKKVDTDPWWAADNEGAYPQDHIGLLITDAVGRTLFAPFTPPTGTDLAGKYTHYGPDTICTPVLIWGPLSDLQPNTPLGSSDLNARSYIPGTVSPLAGSFTYSPPAGTVLAHGQHTLSTTFTPADTDHYTTATMSVALVVVNATPWLTASISGMSPGGPFRGDVLTFTAVGHDADGDPLSYWWSLTKDGVIQGFSGVGSQVFYTIETLGTYAWSVYVNDGQVNSNAVSGNFTAVNRAPTAYIAVSLPEVIYVDDSVVFTDASSDDPDGDSYTVAWAIETKPAGSYNTLSPSTGAAKSSTTFNPGGAGDYTIKLTVTDQYGATDSVSVSFAVTGGLHLVSYEAYNANESFDGRPAEPATGFKMLLHGAGLYGFYAYNLSFLYNGAVCYAHCVTYGMTTYITWPTWVTCLSGDTAVVWDGGANKLDLLATGVPFPRCFQIFAHQGYVSWVGGVGPYHVNMIVSGQANTDYQYLPTFNHDYPVGATRCDNFDLGGFCANLGGLISVTDTGAGKSSNELALSDCGIGHCAPQPFVVYAGSGYVRWSGGVGPFVVSFNLVGTSRNVPTIQTNYQYGYTSSAPFNVGGFCTGSGSTVTVRDSGTGNSGSVTLAACGIPACGTPALHWTSNSGSTWFFSGGTAPYYSQIVGTINSNLTLQQGSGYITIGGTYACYCAGAYVKVWDSSGQTITKGLDAFSGNGYYFSECPAGSCPTEDPGNAGWQLIWTCPYGSPKNQSNFAGKTVNLGAATGVCSWGTATSSTPLFDYISQSGNYKLVGIEAWSAPWSNTSLAYCDGINAPLPDNEYFNTCSDWSWFYCYQIYRKV